VASLTGSLPLRIGAETRTWSAMPRKEAEMMTTCPVDDDGGERNDWSDQIRDDSAIRVIVVDDRDEHLHALVDFLQVDPRIKVMYAAESGLIACVRLPVDRPDIVLVSATLGGYGALDTVRLIKQMYNAPLVALLGRTAVPRAHHTERLKVPDIVIENPKLDGELIAALVSLAGKMRR
jgi:hypothetical protein